MNNRFTIAVCGLALAAVTASAIPTQLVPTGTTALDTYYISKNGTGPGGSNGNNPSDDLFRLETYFIPSVDCTDWVTSKPGEDGAAGSQTYDWSGGGLSGWEYAVIHYGASAHGGGGGSVGAYALNGSDTFTFPSSAFSSIVLYKCDDTHKTPDGGATLALLGIGLLGVESLRRKLAKA